MKLSLSIRRFLEDCELARGLSIKTITNYEHYLSRLQQFLENDLKMEDPDITSIDQEIIRKWRLELNHGRQPVGLATQNYHLVALRAFLKWASKQGLKVLSPEKIELPHLKEPEVVFLDGKEMNTLLAIPSGNSLIGQRDRAIMELLFSTGLRVSELVALDRKQVEKRDEITILGKGGKRRVVFISPRAKEAIDSYLKLRHDESAALFIGTKNSEQKQLGRLTPRSIQRLVANYTHQAGLAEHITPHTLRHSFATDLLQAGADIRSVQMLLGHRSIATTQRYTHVTDQHLKEIHSTFHGRRIKNPPKAEEE